MDWNDPNAVRVFFEIHSDLPREGPGLPEATARALDLARPLLENAPGKMNVVDFGCGPGAQTLVLASRLPAARILANDLHPPFLEEVARRVASAGYAARVTTKAGDMANPASLGIALGSVDLIWSEGAAYSVGVETALKAWRPLLAPGGRIAFSEAVRFVDELPRAARKMWQEYPELTDEAGTRARIAAAGCQCLHSFRLPTEAWTSYFAPQKARLNILEARYRNDPKALSVLAEHRNEIAVYAAHGDTYGYMFFICASDD